MKTYLYGASDDLIEIDGAITDEIGHYGEGAIKFEASDGTKGTIKYDGDWLINLDHIGNLAHKIHLPPGEDKDHEDADLKKIGVPGYSACVEFNDIEWLKIGRKKFKKD